MSRIKLIKFILLAAAMIFAGCGDSVLEVKKASVFESDIAGGPWGP